MKKRTLIIFASVFIIAITLALTVKALFWIIMPLILASILLYLAIVFSKSKWISLIISLSCLLIFYSVAEVYLYITVNPNLSDYSSDSKHIASGITSHINKDNMVKDHVLGYAPKARKVQTAHKLKYRDEAVFDVLYSYDENGRRLTPDNSGTAKNLVLLFGCSFTFGDGLYDKETFAWKLSELLGSNFQVLNYGMSAYGSHQMLALLESDRLDYLKDKYDNIYVYYLSSYAGVESRSYGLGFWNHPGPKYLLSKDDTLSYVGQFDLSHFNSILGQSRFLVVLQAMYKKYIIRDNMLDLHAAIISKSKEVIKEKFNGDFVTVAYPNNEPLKERLLKDDMEFIDLDDYFDNFGVNREKYVIKHDGHPNSLATKIIADTIYENLGKKLE